MPISDRDGTAGTKRIEHNPRSVTKES